MKTPIIPATKYFILCFFALLCTSSIFAQRKTTTTTTTSVTTINPTTNDSIITTTTTEKVEEYVHPSISNFSLGININEDGIGIFKKKKRKLKPHWDGFGVSFMGYSDKNVPYGSVKMSSSYTFTLNLFSVSKQLGKSNFLLVSGVGSDWTKYKFDDNAALTSMNGVPQFLPAPRDVNYVSSKLTAYYITIPLLIEYQVSPFHFSAGAMAMFKWHSKSQTRYYDNRGNRHKETQGRNIVRPVDIRLRAQIGVKKLSVYGYYAPMPLLNKSESPEIRTYAIGMMLNF